MELIDWVEGQAKDNLLFRLNNLENLIKDANSVLLLLLAGIGASMAYGYKFYISTSYEEWLLISVLAVGIYLLVLANILISKCLKIDEIQPPSNEPDNLYQKEFDILLLREIELKNIQERIDKATARNTITAIWLNRVKVAAASTPAVFIISWVVFHP